MAENYQLKAGEIPAIPSRKSQNCCFDFSRFLIDEQPTALHQLEFKSGSKITASKITKNFAGLIGFCQSWIQKF